jgi:hypothetical protein
VPSQAQWGGTFRNGTTSGTSASATQNTWTWTGNGYTVGTRLYLPAGGYRGFNGGLVEVGTNGVYWSTTISGAGAFSLYCGTGKTPQVEPGYIEDGRGYGESVRCIAQ